MKIVFVAPIRSYHSGINTWAKILISKLHERENVSYKVIDTSVTWRRLTQRNPLLRLFGGSFQAFRVCRQTLASCDSELPDIVHVCTSGGPSFVRDRLLLKGLRKRGIPRVLHVRMGQLPGIVSRGGIGWWIARSAMREASMVMVLDEASRLALDQKISGTEIVKCPNFIDINEVEGFINEDNGDADPYDTDVLFVGHVLPSKGVEDLVQACCNFPEIRLAVVGQVEKAYADHLANLANRSAVKIRLTGEMERTTVLREMSRAKAIALPSYTEGFPNVVLEAMAVGVPVIATPVGAVPEILGFGTSSPWGREVKVGNVSSLSEAIADLLSNPGSWKEMGMRARNIVRGRFDVGVVFPMFLMHLEHTVRGEGT